MNDVPESAQVRMEQTAILNARALVEKMEKERRQGLSAKVVVLVTFLAIFSLGIPGFVGMWKRSHAENPTATTEPVFRGTPIDYMDTALRRIETEGNRPAVAPWLATIPAPAVLKVEIDSSGYTTISTEKSTGDSMADSRLMTIVNRAQPFGPRTSKTVFLLKVAVVPGEKQPRFQAQLDQVVVP